MSLLPYGALWITLAIALILSLALRSRPRLNASLTLLLALIAGGLWLWARPVGPESIAVAAWLGYGWRIGPGAWQLTGLTLLVLLTVALLRLISARPTEPPPSRDALWLLPALGLLPLVWAGDPLTAATMLALFGLSWVAALWWGRERPSWGWPLLSLLLLPLLLVWLADAVALSGTTSPLWREVAGAAVLVAAAGLLGVWPLGGWRAVASDRYSMTSLVLLSLPVIAGAAVLLPVSAQPAFSSGQVAVAAVLGLLGLLLGLRWAGRLLLLHPQGIAGLAGALAGLVLLTAVFASESALLAAARLAVVGPPALWLVAARRPDHAADEDDDETGAPHKWLRTGVVVMVWLAAVGVPLTVGFAAVSSLTAAWQPGVRYLLTAILVLLLTGWSAVLSGAALRALRSPAVAAGRASVAARVAVLPALALLSFDPAAISGASLVTWAAVVIPLVAGPVIAWLLDGRIDLLELEGATLWPMSVPAPVGSAARGGRRLVADALAEALAILEGPSGLLWILVIVALLLYIS
jgi:hypothetical protein